MFLVINSSEICAKHKKSRYFALGKTATLYGKSTQDTTLNAYVCMYVCMYAAAIHPYIHNAFLIFNTAFLIPYKNSKEFLFSQFLRN